MRKSAASGKPAVKQSRPYFFRRGCLREQPFERFAAEVDRFKLSVWAKNIRTSKTGRDGIRKRDTAICKRLFLASINQPALSARLVAIADVLPCTWCFLIQLYQQKYSASESQ
jgi:hypothetical protein